MVNNTIKYVSIQFDASDFNKALGVTTEQFAAHVSNNTLVEFFDFIKYTNATEFGKLNKKNWMRQWSFLFGTFLMVFTCKKSSFDQISGPIQ